MKKFLCVLMAVCMALSLCAVPALAEDTITITVDGEFVDCASYGQLPVAIDGRTLVPLRSVFEALGADVTWDPETNTVVSFRGDVTILLSIGSYEMYVNGEVKALSVPAQSMNDRTMVPVRAIAEAFGCEVKWVAEFSRVVVTTTNQEDDDFEKVYEEEVEEDEFDNVELPDEVVSNVYDALLVGDFKTASQYYKDPEQAMGNLGLDGISSISDMISDVGDMTQAEADLVEAFTVELLGMISYEIDSVTIDGDTAEVYTLVSTPDFDSIDMEEYLSEEVITEIIYECCYELGYSSIEEMALVADQDEIDRFTYLLTSNIFSRMIEVFQDAAANGDPIVSQEYAKLEKVDGRWLIVE